MISKFDHGGIRGIVCCKANDSEDVGNPHGSAVEKRREGRTIPDNADKVVSFIVVMAGCVVVKDLSRGPTSSGAGRIRMCENGMRERGAELKSSEKRRKDVRIVCGA